MPSWRHGTKFGDLSFEFKDGGGPFTDHVPKWTRKQSRTATRSSSVADVRRRGRPSTSRAQETVHAVQEMFERSPRKSTRQAARESGLSRYTVVMSFEWQFLIVFGSTWARGP